MKINEQLVKKVQDRTHCIEFTPGTNSCKQLNKVIEKANNTDEIFSGMCNYYFLGIRGRWDFSDTIPSGMTPIPLKDFFVEEVEEWKVGDTFTTPETGNKAFLVTDVTKYDVVARDTRSAAGYTNFAKSYITKVPSPSVPVDKVDGEGIQENETWTKLSDSFRDIAHQYKEGKIDYRFVFSWFQQQQLKYELKEHSKHSIIN